MLGLGTSAPVRKVVAAITFLTIAGIAGETRAQEAPPFDPAIEVQLFEYATGRHSFLTVPDADVTGDKQFNLDFLVTFITEPFTIYNVDEPQDEIDEMDPVRTKVVESVVAGAVGGAFGFHDKFEIGVALPMIFSMSGEGINVAEARPGDGLQASGLGDLRAELKWRFWQNNNLRAALIPGITLPTSVGTSPDDADLGSGDLLGDNWPTLRARAAVQWSDNQGNLTLGGTVGAAFRKPREIYSSEVGQQLMYGAAANFRVTDSVDAVAEVFGRAGLFNIDLDASPVELNGALRIQATKSFSVLAGGGAGLVKGIGSPGLRMFVSVGWSPDFRDSDGDGVANNKDQCPLLAEDKDGYEDRDGCPDEDNDGDKREDSIDKCPNEAEDLDGFDDDDGCPEPDNDNDGLLDRDDRCPNYAEDGKPPYDKDGCPADKRDSDDDGTFDAFDKCPDEPEDEDEFEDWDGCPDVDNDGDDIPDEFDACPLCREDKDDFDDDDGCPEIDNDGDGIPDSKDQCPGEAEVVNGLDDFDGCPDDGGAMLVQLDGDRLAIDASIKFKSGEDRLHKRGAVIVDQIAAVMITNPDVIKWRIVVVAPDAGSEGATRRSSQARADHLKAYCAARGVDADKIEAIGAVADNPMIAIVVLERAEEPGEDEPKICPAGFEAVAREPSDDEPAAAVEAPAVVAETTATDPDADGVAGLDDRCPTDPEDRDGFEDDDGCPDEDNDGDGVDDANDKCPAKAETPNGYQDDDGCPDEVPEQVKKFSGAIKGINFETGSATITADSYPVLDEAAKVIAEFGMYVEIQGHTDNKGSRSKNTTLSQGRADSVRAYLVSKGVTDDHLSSIGFGPDRPVASNRSEDGRAQNRRVEFRLITDAERKEKQALAQLPELEPFAGVYREVNFKRSTDKLSKSSHKHLDALAQVLVANPQVRVSVRAHTDGRKGPDKSREITQSQADAVAAYLIEKGVPAGRIKAVGHGMNEPIGDNSTSKGRAANRRIELGFTIKQ